MKILVVAAHPDDEILGCAGTLLRHKERGDEIYVCIVTSAYTPDWSQKYIDEKNIEQQKVDELLGTTQRFNLGFPTVKLNTVPHGVLNDAVTKIVEKVDPYVIYTHFENDINYDHTLTFRACMVATRPPHPTKLICFETISETRWNNKPFIPNFWVDITKQIDKKIELFKIYRSENKKYPHPRSVEGLRILGNKTGMEMCMEYAESFIVIKEFWTI